MRIEHAVVFYLLSAAVAACGRDGASPGQASRGGGPGIGSGEGGTSGPGGPGGSAGTGGSSGGAAPGGGGSVPVDAPPWVADIPAGVWAKVSANTMADVDPEDDAATNPNYPDSAPWHANSGQKCVLNCWNGGAFAWGYGAHGALLAFGGGHAGYYGSEVYAFDMGNQKWERVTDPYPGPIDFPYADGAYPDGSSIPMHTYDQVDYDPGTHSLVVLKAIIDGYPGTASVSIPVVRMLDLATGQWRASARDDEVSLAGGGNSCFDRNRNVFWIANLYEPKKLTKFDPSPMNPDGTYGTFTHFPGDPVQLDGGAACDPEKDLYVYTEFRYSGSVFARDLANPTAARVEIQQGGDPPQREGAGGFEWSPRRHAFLYWRRGAGVYELAPPSGDWASGTWVWTNLTSAANTIEPEPMETDNGVYSRFRIAEYRGDEVAVVVTRVDGGVYAFRVP